MSADIQQAVQTERDVLHPKSDISDGKGWWAGMPAWEINTAGSDGVGAPA